MSNLHFLTYHCLFPRKRFSLEGIIGVVVMKRADLTEFRHFVEEGVLLFAARPLKPAANRCIVRLRPVVDKV